MPSFSDDSEKRGEVPEDSPETRQEELEAWRHFARGRSPDLLAAARHALREGTPMHHRALRALGEPALVRVALALAEARLRGAEKFSWADHLLADPQGVEVATPERLARLKAHRFAQRSCGGSRRSKRADRCRGTRGEQRDSHGGTPILLDLACGIGGDGREL
ncbi:MAG TPA: hypothetical protein ENK02_15690, partial [Planctomycetes bacterium]|nr:hypothetical protein [Planctomycetota bacterium]